MEIRKNLRKLIDKIIPEEKIEYDLGSRIYRLKEIRSGTLKVQGLDSVLDLELGDIFIFPKLLGGVERFYSFCTYGTNTISFAQMNPGELDNLNFWSRYFLDYYLLFGEGWKGVEVSSVSFGANLSYKLNKDLPRVQYIAGLCRRDVTGISSPNLTKE